MATTYLQYDREELERRKALITASEIENQPKVWRLLFDVLKRSEQKIDAFMNRVLAIPGLRIVFTGAGSSAFIGESACLMLQRENNLHSENIHTTDIVATPDAVLYDVPTLLISYSRSGSSPESVGAIACASRCISELYNLVLVCNSDSKLARMELEGDHNLIVNIPQEASDMGFAMTCSVSCMMLATWFVFARDDRAKRLAYIRSLADAVEASIPQISRQAKEYAAFPYDRIVYLGFGALRGLAREGAIKSQELTAGRVVATYDTPTGFRHGPKTVVEPHTVTVHLISPVALAGKYDLDLLNEIMAEKKGNMTVAVAPGHMAGQIHADGVVLYDILPEYADSELCSYLYGLLFLQLLSFEKSLALGITTDNPCPDGGVNRVVRGVKLYEMS